MSNDQEQDEKEQPEWAAVRRAQDYRDSIAQHCESDPWHQEWLERAEIWLTKKTNEAQAMRRKKLAALSGG